jgi:uncharacterized protein YndB with AHSA1/START domain
VTETPAESMNPGDVGGPGILRVDEEKASIVFRRLLRHPIHDVWSAITDPKKLEAWFMVRVAREDSPGGQLAMEHPNGVHATGRVLEWRPPRTYEYEWNLLPGANQPSGETSIVRWQLTPVEGGTLLVMTHRKLTRPTAEVFVRGFRVFLDRLSAQMDGTPLPEPPWIVPAGGTSGTDRRP